MQQVQSASSTYASQPYFSPENVKTRATNLDIQKAQNNLPTISQPTFGNLPTPQQQNVNPSGVPILTSTEARQVTNFMPYWEVPSNLSGSQYLEMGKKGYASQVQYNPVTTPSFSFSNGKINLGMTEPKGTSFSAWQQIYALKKMENIESSFQTNPESFRGQAGFGEVITPTGTTFSLDITKNNPELANLGVGSESYKFAQAKFDNLPFKSQVGSLTAGMSVGIAQFGLGTGDFVKSVMWNLPQNFGVQTTTGEFKPTLWGNWKWQTTGGFEGIRSVPSTPTSISHPTSFLESPETITQVGLTAGFIYQGVKGFYNSYKTFRGADMPVSTTNYLDTGAFTTGATTKVSRFNAVGFAGGEAVNTISPIKMKTTYMSYEAGMPSTALQLANIKATRTGLINEEAVLSQGEATAKYGQYYNFRALKITPNLFGNMVITTSEFPVASAQFISATGQFLTKPNLAYTSGKVTESFGAGTRDVYLTQQYSIETKFGFERGSYAQKIVQVFPDEFSKSVQLSDKASLSKGGTSIKNIEKYGITKDFYTFEGKPFGTSLSGRPYKATGKAVSIKEFETTTDFGTIITGKGGSKLTSGRVTTDVPFNWQYAIPKEVMVMNLKQGGGTRLMPKESLISQQTELEIYASQTVPSIMQGRLSLLSVQQPSATLLSQPSMPFLISQPSLSSTSISSLSPLSINKQVSFTPQALIPMSIQGLSSVSLSGLSQFSITSTAEKIALITITTPTSTPTIITPFNPITTTPFIPPFAFPSFRFDFGNLGSRKYKGKQPKKYTPSFESFVLNIRGKAPKGKETGFRIRPITKGFTFANKKFKMPRFRL